MSESTEQIEFVKWCDLQGITVFHIPNGGSRNKVEAMNLKRQGVKSGVPDLMIPIPKGKYHGLFIEMKYGKNKPTDNQKRWLRLLTDNGYGTVICYSTADAIKVTMEYMKL